MSRSSVIRTITRQLQSLNDSMRVCTQRFNDDKVVMDQYAAAVGVHKLESKRLADFKNHLETYPLREQKVGCWTCYLIIQTTKNSKYQIYASKLQAIYVTK